MLLSIVMMIKNEQKYLDKTLKSLKRLMDKIDSELIILDTGSTDCSVDIAKKYTDKVYFAKWNDDFGSMRNISISYANGEWVLILDADEELIEFDKLEKFFNLNLHKKYNCATIEIDNIVSENEKTHSIATMLRIFRKTEDFKYMGAIHEQPIFTGPIYKSGALFKHYGYLFENEEVKQLKDSRNKKILLKEIEKNPNDPYMNYQLGKTYSVSSNFEDALFYMQKAYKLYNNTGRIPIFVITDLIVLYMDLNYLDKCEKICSDYIKTDNKNIDIYYYLAAAQKRLGKYKKSLENYKRYLYLLDNYEISTQANRVDCNGETISFKNHVKSNIIDNYYKLEMYDEIINSVDSLDYEVLKSVYSVVFMTLYRFDKLDKIVEIYSQNSDNIMKLKELNQNLELLIVRAKEIDREKIYKVLSNINGDYGILNQIRLGKELTISEYNEILKYGNELYYSEFMYYAIQKGIDIVQVLDGVNYLKIKYYMEYLVINKRDIILSLYSYVNESKNTMNIKNIRIYECISKYLLEYGGLINEKYENLFLEYIKNSYHCIKYSYKNTINDDELLDILRSNDDKFVVNINRALRLKKINKLEYIKSMKRLLVENPQYKKGIEILKNQIEKDLNESNELKELKLKYKSIIESSINNSKFDEAISMINEYEAMFSQDVEILNMKSIIALLNNNFVEAEMLLKKALLLDNNNFNTIFNVGYLKEVLGETEEAISFYNKILADCENKEIVLDVKDKVRTLSAKII